MQILKKKWDWLLLISCALLIYAINFANFKWLVGGDIENIFYNSQYNLIKNVSLWNPTNGFGAPDIGGKIQYLPIQFIIFLLVKTLGGALAQQIYYLCFYILFFIVTYWFYKSIINNRIHALLATGLYLSSFFIWQILYRSLDTLSLGLLIGIPLVGGLMARTHVLRKKFASWVWVFALYIFSLSFTNIGYGLFGLFFLFLFQLYLYEFNIKAFMSHRAQWFKFSLMFSVILLPVMSAWLLFLFTNTNNYNDEWQRGLLTLNSINSQRDGSRLIFALRGLNADIAFQDGYLSGKAYYYLSNLGYLFNPFVIALQFIPFLTLLLTVLIQKNKKIFYLFIVTLVIFFLYKGAAPPFGSLYSGVIEHIPILSIFRNPHQKIAVGAALLFFLFVVIALDTIRNRLLFIITRSLLVLLIVLQFALFFSPVYHAKQRADNIPSDYYQAADYINTSEKSKSIVILPYYQRAWTETSFGYEGYSLLQGMVNKEIFNLESSSAHKANAQVIETLNNSYEKPGDASQWVDRLISQGITTIVLDRYLIPEERRYIDNPLTQYSDFLHTYKSPKVTVFNKLTVIEYSSDKNRVLDGDLLEITPQITLLNLYKVRSDSKSDSKIVLKTSNSKWWVAINAKRVEADESVNMWQSKPSNDIYIIYLPDIIRIVVLATWLVFVILLCLIKKRCV